MDPPVEPADDTSSAFTRTTALELDADSSHLSGAHQPKEINETAKIAVRNSLRNWNVTGDVVSVSHGTVEGAAATLVVFRFRFRYEAASSDRLSKADIVIQLRAPSDNQQRIPTARQFAPRLIHSTVTLANMTKEQSLTTGISAPSAPSPLQLGLHGTVKTEAQFVKELRTEVLGQAWTSDEAYEAGSEHDDTVSWTLTENKHQGDGIPHELHTALLVQRDDVDTLQATVQIKCKTSSGLALFGWPWSRPRPLRIRDDVAFGRSLGTSRFEQLNEAQWEQLVGIDRPYTRIRVTDQHQERACTQ